jgi:ribonuclease HII
MKTLWIAGVDEAGRGPWAGPVYAAAVILDPARPITGLADSKKLSAKKREALFEVIQRDAKAWAIASASAAEIDAINILQASLLAMRRAVETLDTQPHKILVDGLHCPKVSMPARAIVKGDSKEAAISAASILAKVARDRVMLKLHQQYPHYGFDAHKGYGTAMHIAALEAHGVSPVHRRSYAPIVKLLNKNN